MNSSSRSASIAPQNVTISPQLANLFGTDGIRARVGTFPFTESDLIKLGCAIGTWATTKYGPHPRLLLGHDTRESASFMIDNLSSGLFKSRISLFNAGILPTPAIIKLALLDASIDGALIITASHNPYHDNGIKLIDRQSGKLSTQDEELITELFYKDTTYRVHRKTKQTHPYYQNDGNLSLGQEKEYSPFVPSPDEGQTFDKYEKIIPFFKKENVPHRGSGRTDKEICPYLKYVTLNTPPLGKIYELPDAQKAYVHAIASYFVPQFLAHKRIVLDCAHGATSNLAPAIFRMFGATVHAISNQPNGRNINDQCGATHPELIARTVIQEQADIGFAFDGDGDRVVAVNKHGIIKDGDDILALLLDHPAYAQEPTLVCTIMSNAGLDELVRNKQKTIIRTAVGDKHISAELKNKNLLIGGEQSGHIVLADFLNGGDGIFAALRICELANLKNNWDLVSFDHVAQIMINLPVAQKRDLQDSVLQEIITAAKAELCEGIVVVRYSGTENILRIMVQHRDQKQAELVSALLAKKLKHELK